MFNLIKKISFALVLSLPLGVNADITSLFKSEMPSLAPMLEKVTPAVVNIYTLRNVKQKQQNPFRDDPFFRKFFNMQSHKKKKERNRAGLGSGVIINKDKGLIITNNHVIAKATDIKVRLSDGREYKAKVVGNDSATDIAIIKIEADNLMSLKFANSDDLRVGDFVVAIGNPFGIGQTVTSGIVSALGRSGLGIEAYENFIQTDASINPGNSGGALVNLNGELVGINTAIIGARGSSAGSVGIGLAIPVNMALSVTEQLIKFGHVKRGILGVAAQDLTEDLAKGFGIKEKKGAIIIEVEKGSIAEKHGLKVGDIVIEMNGKKIKNSLALKNEIGLTEVGTKIKLKVISNKIIKNIVLEMVETKVAKKSNLKINQRLNGMQFSEITRNMPEYNRVEGIKIIKIRKNTKAYNSGIRANDIILSINNVPVKKIKDLELVAGSNDSELLLHLLRGNRTAFILLK